MVPSLKQLGILLNNVFIDLRPGLCAGVDSNETKFDLHGFS
jgi:hypothetical protein